MFSAFFAGNREMFSAVFRIDMAFGFLCNVQSKFVPLQRFVKVVGIV